jgi:hypothetical protein
MQIELRILELCGENIYRTFTKEEILELLDKHKPKILEKCYQLGKRECEQMRNIIKYDDKALELKWLDDNLDKCVESKSLNIIAVLDNIFKLRLYC